MQSDSNSRPEVPRIALIVLNWNGWHDTDRCLDSLERVTYPYLDVHVVDNGSGDDSLRELSKRRLQRPILSLPRNLGYTGGNNAGIRAALDSGADIIGVLNNDTRVEPDFLEPIAAALIAEPNAYASPRITYTGRPDEAWFEDMYLDDRTSIGYHRTPLDNEPGIREVPAVTGCCLIAPASVWRRVGLFDERYFVIFEDADWCARARRHGMRGLVVGTSRIDHVVGASFASSRSRMAAYYYLRNGLLFLKSNARPWCGRGAHFVADVYRTSVARALRLRDRPSVSEVLWQTLGLLDFAFGRYGKRYFS